MADFEQTARSNYFRVTDRDKLETLVRLFDISMQMDNEGRVALFANGDHGNWPSSVWLDDEVSAEDRAALNSLGIKTTDDEGNEGMEDAEFDIIDVLASILADGEVCVLVYAGAEKMRYVGGGAYAFNNKGESRTVNIDNIYDLALDLGTNVTRAEY